MKTIKTTVLGLRSFALFAAVLACLISTTSCLFWDGSPDGEKLGAVEAVDPDQVVRGIYTKLTGISINPESGLYSQMRALVVQNKAYEAALLVSGNEIQVVDNKVLHFAATMFDQNNANDGVNEFSAFIMGLFHDKMDYRLWLTAGGGGLRWDPATDNAGAALTNVHSRTLQNAAGPDGFRNAMYQEAMDKRIKFSNYVFRSEQFGGSGGLGWQAVGAVTSTALGKLAFDGGTNRRQFDKVILSMALCKEPEDVMAAAPATMIRRDVAFAPDPEQFLNFCAHCHGRIDAVSGSGCYYEYDPNTRQLNYHPGTVTASCNRNPQNNPTGHAVTDDSFIVDYPNSAFNLGLPNDGHATGNGFLPVAEMFANSTQFARCAVQRSFVEVCGREHSAEEEEMVGQLADRFMNEGYQLYKLWAAIVVQKECGGVSQ